MQVIGIVQFLIIQNCHLLVHRLDVERIVLLQKILRFLDYIIKGSYKAGGNKHIFTDQELYEEYNLTDEEINIIESVIKGRK